MRLTTKLKQKSRYPLVPIAALLLVIGFIKLVTVTYGKGCQSVIDVSFKCKQVIVTSSKDISHVIIYFQNYEAVKFDNMNVGKVWSLSSEKLIESVTVKSGCTQVTYDNDNCNALPIFWSHIDLDGQMLKWGTYTELNNDEFIVYGINKDLSRDSLGSVAGHGTSLDAHIYSYAMPREYLYAVVKQIDFDGSEDYSKVAVNRSLVKKIKDEPVYNILGQQLR